MVSEEMDNEWRRLGPAEVSETPSLDGSEPGCRSLSRSRSAVRAARTLLSELCTFWARAQKLRCRWA